MDDKTQSHLVWKCFHWFRPLIPTMHYQESDVQGHQWIVKPFQPAEDVPLEAQCTALVDHALEVTLQRHTRSLISCIWNKVVRHHI